MASARNSLAVSIFLMVIAHSTSEETCKKVKTCSCKFNNGSIVDLVPPGGKTETFKQIPETDGQGRKFDWNPCITFSETRCTNVLSCQITGSGNYPAGTTETTFSVDGEGNAVITYGKSTSSYDSKERQTVITLKCDPTTNGTKPTGFKGKESGQLTTYSGTYRSKYCCATGGSSSLSVGSILLIIFFPLLLMYFIIGILVNRYGRGIESMPELIPNYSFWADVPFLVKDGFVFTYDRIKTTCAGKCGKSGYAEI